MDLVQKIGKIKKYICDHFEEWGLDDPVEEGYYSEYEDIQGADAKEIKSFEEKFEIVLPEDIKEIYRYKNGSKFFGIFPSVIGNTEMAFCLMSLQKMEKTKEFFQNRDALLSEFPDYFTSEDIEKMKDNRVQPYLFHTRWIPFAECWDSCYLMLDFAPDKEGRAGQIICYMHDPDRIIYVDESVSHFISETVENLIEKNNSRLVQ